MTSSPFDGRQTVEEDRYVAPNRLLAVVNWVLEAAAVVTMGALSLLVFCNAIGRYFFASPLPWTEEMVLNLLIWLAAIGITLAALRGQLVTCDIITTRMRSVGARRALAFACALIGSATMLYCCWLAVEYLMVFGGRPSLLLGLPKGVAIAALLLSFAGIAAALVASLFSRR